MIETAWPRLAFNMFQVGTREGIMLANGAFKNFYGSENYGAFRKAGKGTGYIGEEEMQKVDREIFARVERMFGVQNGRGEAIWKQALDRSNATIDYSRKILFIDQDRQASMITDIERDWDSGRPSKALQRLTMPSTRISEELKFEQGRQLSLALLCAEIIGYEQTGASKLVLEAINDAMYGSLIIGKIGAPRNHRVFSYHFPRTNRLEGVSDKFPDRNFPSDNYWVKQLDLPVRKMKLQGRNGEANSIESVIYDPREKDMESAVVKAIQRSLKEAQRDGEFGQSSIDVSPHVEDRLGLRLVLMQGGHPLRDRLAEQMGIFFSGIKGVWEVTPDNEVNPKNGKAGRVKFKRMQVSIDGLRDPLEVIVQSLEDFIPSAYEVGDFDPEKGMHDGSAHDLYKLKIVGDIAEYLWPPKIYGIDIARAKKLASYEYALRLGRKQRIHPSPYPEMVA